MTLAEAPSPIYHLGVDFISVLQSSFPNAESFFMEISSVFDPKYVFTLYFPVVFALKWVLGVQLLGTIIVVEWLNQVLKWLMHGDRPYWWVAEVEEAHNSSNLLPDIHQFKSTCETGPGMPSGHSMAMSAAWYVVVHAAVENLVRPSKLSSSVKQQIVHLLWTYYIVTQVLVMTSRMYIAAHFPHQCFLGVFLGISLAKQVYGRSKWICLKRPQWMAVSSLILLSALGTYCLLLWTGKDPAWSIGQAYKWCAKREYIHVDTTPFYSLTRYSGAAFGLGLGLTSRFFTSERKSFGKLHVLTTMALGVAAGIAADITHHVIPKSSESLFYSLEFLLNVALPYLVIVSPKLAMFLIRKEKSA